MKRQGFALPLVMGIMVVAFLIAAGMLHVAMSDFRASHGTHQSTRALLAAEAGAELTLAALNATTPFPLAPGDSASTGWRELRGRARYASTTLRVDDGTAGPLVVRILTEGRTEEARSARSRVVLIATCVPADTGATAALDVVDSSCVISTATTTGGVHLSELARFRAQ